MDPRLEPSSTCNHFHITHNRVESWIENSPVCTKIIDLDFNLIYMSASGVKELKIEKVEDYYGKPYPFPFYPEEFKTLMNNSLNTVKETGQAITYEAWVTDTQGKEIWYQTTLLPIHNDEDVFDSIMIVAVNITGKKLSEQALVNALGDMESRTERRTRELLESEERFSLAMRGANDGLWDWNLETDEVYYSPRWKSMLGYEEHELGNTLDTWASLVNPEDKEYVLEQVRNYITGRSNSYEVEMRLRHKDGGEVVVLSRAFLTHRESDGKPIRLVGTHVDITEQKKAKLFDDRNSEILKMIAIGRPASEIYDAIALMYEERHPGMRCSMLELEGDTLLHGGAPSLPKEYCDAVHGLKIGPNIGSCGTSTFTGKRCIVENIETDPKWANIKDYALPHGMRCCWSEPVINSSGEVLGAFGMYYNHPALPNEDESNDLVSAARLTSIVMERDQAQKRIRQLAYTDELTGLASRAYFVQHVEELIKSSRRRKRRFSLLYIDLDNFKDVNDSLGHDIGDLLLKEISKRLARIGDEIDFLARLSGDEFCILIEDISDDFAAANVAQHCLEIISEPIRLTSRKLIPACSIGIAHYPDDGETQSILLKAADTSLYAAKEDGKNRYAFYKPELTQKAEYRFLVEQYLREAIEKEKLSLVYQPQIDIYSGEIIGFEALSRLEHPALGNIEPTEFIVTAERIGMIKQLTEWVLYTACSQTIAWKNAGAENLRIAVNISPTHFLDKEILSLVKSVIDQTGIAPADLTLEVTEVAVQTDNENISIFQGLKDMGISLAIDDFGTGYSSFASLKHLQIDCLKIDKYFINDILIDMDALILVGSMIEMGHNLGHGIIAEGIETTEQLEVLRKLGCETVQGRLFSNPMTVEDASRLLQSDNSFF